jgi:hypothetical protein
MFDAKQTNKQLDHSPPSSFVFSSAKNDELFLWPDLAYKKFSPMNKLFFFFHLDKLYTKELTLIFIAYIFSLVYTL